MLATPFVANIRMNNQGYTPEEIEIRCDEVDRKNCEISEAAARKYASQIVKSGA